jgi:hypothetical protein
MTEKKNTEVVEITKEKWNAYRTVQSSGATNMFHVKNVIKYAKQICDVELTKNDCLYIMSNYPNLMVKYSK